MRQGCTGNQLPQRLGGGEGPLAGGNIGSVRGNITITYDSNGVARARNDLGQFVSMSALLNDQLSGSTNRANRSFNVFGKTLLKVVGIIFAGVAALQSMLTIIQLLIVAISQLGPVAFAGLSVIPGIILTIVAAMGVLKLALAGVGDAFKAAAEGDAGKFNEAIQKLAPNARQAAIAFRDLVTAVKPIQQAIQNAFFAGVGPQILALRASVAAMAPEAVAVATGFNSIVRAIAGAVASNQTIASMRQIMIGLASSLQAIAPGIGALVQGFITLGGQLGLFTGSAGKALNGFLESFGDAMANINLAAVLDNAKTILTGLGSFLSDIGTIFSNIFGALTSQSTGALNPIAALVSKIAEFTESAAGAAALNTLGIAMQAIAGAVGQALLALLNALAPAIVAIAPLAGQLATLLGGILATAFQTLGPPITQLVTALAGALAPVLPQIAAAFQSLAPVIGRIAAVLGGVLGPLLEGLAPVLGALVVALSEGLLAALQAVLPSLEQYVPVFAQLAQEMLPQLVPLVIEMGKAFVAVAPALGAVAELLVGILVPVMQEFSPVILLVVSALTALVGGFAMVAGWVSQIIAKFTSMNVIMEIVRALTSGIAALWTWLFNLLIGNSIIPDLINGIFSWFRRLAELPGMVAGFFRSMASAAASAVGSLLSVVRAIPGQVMSALGNLGSLLFSAGRNIIQGLVDGVRSMAGAVKDAVANVMSAARNLLPFSPAKEGPFSGRGWSLYSGRAIMEDMARGLLQGASAVQAAMDGAMGGLASTITVTGSTGLSGGATTPSTPVAPTGVGLTVNQTVNALPGMSAQQVGNYALQRLVFGVQTGTSSVVDTMGG